MPLLLWPYNLETSEGFLNFLLLLVGMGLSAFAYNRSGLSGRRILDDPDVTAGLTAEERLRLGLGLIDTSAPMDAIDLVDPHFADDRREVIAAVRKAREESRRRERGDLDELNPRELSRLRQRMDHIVREHWARIEQQFYELSNDQTGEAWDPLVNGETGLMALLTDLALELHAAKRQPTYPPVVLQLEGPLGTLADVVRHAQQAIDAATSPGDVHQLRTGVLAFVADVFPQICANIQETEIPYELDPEFDLAREVELTNQDLPTE